MSMTMSEIRASQQKRNREFKLLVQSGRTSEAKQLAKKRLVRSGILDKNGKVNQRYR